jgi:hypothetical protein
MSLSRSPRAVLITYTAWLCLDRAESGQNLILSTTVTKTVTVAKGKTNPLGLTFCINH